MHHFGAGKHSVNSSTEVDDGYITTVTSSTKVARHDVQLLLYSRCVLYMNVTLAWPGAGSCVGVHILSTGRYQCETVYSISCSVTICK